MEQFLHYSPFVRRTTGHFKNVFAKGAATQKFNIFFVVSLNKELDTVGDLRSYNADVIVSCPASA